MFEALDITEEDLAGLNECAAADLELMRVFKGMALAEADPELKMKFARTAQRHLRSYRQDILLKARLKRDLQRALAEAPEAEPPRRPPTSPAKVAQVSDRVTELHNTALKVAWAEYLQVEGLDDETEADPGALAGYFGGLEAWINRACVAKGFGDQPFEAHFLDLCRELELDPQIAARWRDLPMPPEDAWQDLPAPPEAPKPKSSVSEGYYKPAGWKPGDPLGYYRPP